jgi:hypothetical protein
VCSVLRIWQELLARLKIVGRDLLGRYHLGTRRLQAMTLESVATRQPSPSGSTSRVAAVRHSGQNHEDGAVDLRVSPGPRGRSAMRVRSPLCQRPFGYFAALGQIPTVGLVAALLGIGAVVPTPATGASAPASVTSRSTPRPTPTTSTPAAASAPTAPASARCELRSRRRAPNRVAPWSQSASPPGLTRSPLAASSSPRTPSL